MCFVEFSLLASQDPASLDEWLKQPLFEGHVFGLKTFFGYDIRPMVLNGWKMIGFTGMFLFTSRWFVQLWVSKQKRQVTMPRSFWLLSIFGSLLLLFYFIGYQKDSVGTLANLFPLSVACYNLWLDLTCGRERRQRLKEDVPVEDSSSEDDAN